MATITGLTAERMLEIEANSVVDGDIVGDDLFLTKKDGSLINAGNVRGPRGADGPMGAAQSIIAARPVLDVGMLNQIRAGRQLAPSDFTNMGLAAPRGLWNLSNVTDSSGGGRNLTNKGSVPFGVGILGGAGQAAQFAGSAGQVLYISDTGAADTFRIKTGSVGCWCRTAKRGVAQWTVSKWDDNVAGRRGYMLGVNSNNVAQWNVSSDGTAANTVAVVGTSDIADDRWHFIVGTFDGNKVRIYVDGALEASVNFGVAGGSLFATPAPFNIGGYNGEAATATTAPFFGRIDEAFLTPDVLSDDEIRNLYSAAIPHALAVVPSILNLTVQKRRRGATLSTTDFPAQPSRLYNFINGALTDQGVNNVAFAYSGAAQAAVAGADGSRDSAVPIISGSHLVASDSGMPSGLNPRTYGLWLKSTAQNTAIMGWGTYNTAHALIYTANTAGGPLGVSSGADNMTGPPIADGLWHFVVVVEDNTAADGVKRKLYVDGRVVNGSTGMNSITLGGVGRFRVGEIPTGGPLIPFAGNVDGVFVYPGALTSDQVRALYQVSSQALSPMPIIPAVYIKGVESGRLLGYFDTLETSDLVGISAMP